nr:unnamed protein product [Digitaria exilis]
MSSSATFCPTMSQSASRWPASASLRSSFCFRRTVSAARISTFSGRPPPSGGAPFFPFAASLGRSSLMAATALTPRRCLLPCCRGAPSWNGARQSALVPRRPGAGLAARRRAAVNSLHGAAAMVCAQVGELVR